MTERVELLQRLLLNAVRVQLEHMVQHPANQVVRDDETGVVYLLIQRAVVVQLVDVFNLSLPVVGAVLDGFEVVSMALDGVLRAQAVLWTACTVVCESGKSAS